MNYLYLDNFRGFQDTYIPIKDVNFLVGENSTGKTSVMALLNLLTQRDFWVKEKFNSEDFEFGNYDDIVSSSSQDRSYFTVGYCQKDNNAGKSNISYFWCFSEKNGNPEPIKYIILYESEKITEFIFDLKAKKVFYKELDDNECIVTASLFKTNDDAAYDDITNRFNTNNFKLSVQKNNDDLSLTINRILNPFAASGSKVDIFFDMLWIAPLRAAPKRTYDTFDFSYDITGKDIPFILRNIYNEDKAVSKKIIDSIENFGKISGLFDRILIKDLGSDAAYPFQLQVEINRSSLNIKNVGYGVSQSLPVLVNFLRSPKGQWHAVQQPEVHLHPKAQAALGGLIYTLSEFEQKCFLIETHSDHIIDRFRLKLNGSKSKSKPQAQILYFEKSERGNIVNSINIDDTGQISDDQPDTYREFFISEKLELINI